MKHSPRRSFAALRAWLTFMSFALVHCENEGGGEDKDRDGGRDSTTSGACASSQDCGEKEPICAMPAAECVECTRDDHCKSGRCIEQVCHEARACRTSRDCVGGDGGSICDSQTGRCAQCIGANDCEGTADCLDKRCVPYRACMNSLDCEAPQVCDPARARCVVCLGDADCRGKDEVCVANQCVVRRACASDNQCTPAGQLCDKPAGYCVDCLAADGCSGGKLCVQGLCIRSACQPGERQCQGNKVTQCNALGTGFEVISLCDAGMACRAGACEAQACEPSAKTCDGSRAIQCNALGSGFVPGGLDCAQEGKECVKGVCVECGGGAGPIRQLKLVEVGIGYPDFVRLRNTSTSCPVQLRGLRLHLDWRAANVDPGPLSFDLPERSLAPNEELYVVEGEPSAGDVALPSALIFFETDGGGLAALCGGTCGTGTILDLFAFSHNQAAPNYPGEVMFTPLTSLSGAEFNTRAYVRRSFEGTNPSFKASDWTTGTPSRKSDPPGNCPATQPENGSVCLAPASMTCTYGPVTCTCTNPPFGTWTCP